MLKILHMKKLFICLANSYKCSGRCLGGIEITENQDIVYHDGRPKWIRPVSPTEHGALATQDVQCFKIFDIIEIDVVNLCPDCAHSENIYYSSIKRKGNFEISKHVIECLCDNVHNPIFYNRGKAVLDDIYQKGDYSLMLIKPESPSIYFCDETKKYRVKFSYIRSCYDLPITDPCYLSLLKKDSLLCRKRETGELYFVISLGEKLDDWHYKLIACVIDVNSMS